MGLCAQRWLGVFSWFWWNTESEDVIGSSCGLTRFQLLLSRQSHAVRAFRSQTPEGAHFLLAEFFQVVDGTLKRIDIVLEKSQAFVAVIAKKATEGVGFVAVIYTPGSSPSRFVCIAYGATIILSIDHIIVFGVSKSIMMFDVLCPHTFLVAFKVGGIPISMIFFIAIGIFSTMSGGLFSSEFFSVFWVCNIFEFFSFFYMFTVGSMPYLVAFAISLSFCFSQLYSGPSHHRPHESLVVRAGVVQQPLRQPAICGSI
jgi:hypothetical protein